MVLEWMPDVIERGHHVTPEEAERRGMVRVTRACKRRDWYAVEQVMEDMRQGGIEHAVVVEEIPQTHQPMLAVWRK